VKVRHKFQVAEAEDLDDLYAKIQGEIQSLDPEGSRRVVSIDADMKPGRHRGLLADVVVTLQDDDTVEEED